MAEVIRYVDPDATGSGDGTSWANAYTSLNAWEAAEETDLVTAGDWHHVYCRSSSGTADTNNVSVDGWTTDSTHYILIENYDNHGGKWDSTKYRIEANAGYVAALNMADDYVQVIGLQLTNIATASAGGILFNANNYGKVIKCIIKGCSDDGIKDNGTDNAVVNTIVYECLNGIHKRSTGGTLYVYNSTVCNNDTYGIYGEDYRTVYLKNVYAGGNGTADYYKTANSTINLTTCYSSDGSLSTTTAAYSTTSGAYFTNLTSGSEDYHIQSSSALIDNGTDLSSDSVYAFSDDIDGDTRSGTWDIGADEYVSAGGTDVTVSLSQLLGSGAINSLTVSGSANVLTSLLSGYGGLNTLSVSGDANIVLNALTAGGTIYSLTVVTSGDTVIPLSLLSGSGTINAVSVTADANAVLSLLSGVGSVNSLSVSGDANVSLSRLSGAGTLYSVTVLVGDVIVALNRLEASGKLNSVTVDAVRNITVALSQLLGTGSLNSLTVILPTPTIPPAISEQGSRMAECLKQYSLRVVAAKAAAEADGGIDRITYFDYLLTVYSKNGNKWEVDIGC